MQSKEQYLNLYRECRTLIGQHSAPVMNVLRDEAHDELLRMGFPTRQAEDYKYTDVEALLAPDYGLNISRLDIPVNPYDVFKCDVPNMSTALYFVVNDRFYTKALPKVALPEGVILSDWSYQREKGISLKGDAGQSSDVYELKDKMEEMSYGEGDDAVKVFGAIKMGPVGSAKGGRVRFNLDLEYPEEGLP
jgi:hypothetical protein